MKNLKKVFKITIIFVLLFLFYDRVYKGYMYCNEYSGYIHHGFSGLDELFRKDGKVEFYWKEYYKFDLLYVFKPT
ncbi:MAG: hypothetical protein K0R77_3308 [Chryseobacterium sp.]|jgi:hypothetical protein|nr:hypothetical protein [Chryseobacterium sp.]